VTVRDSAPADQSAIAALIEMAAAHDGVEPLGESKYLDLTQSGAGTGLVWEEANSLRGYAHVLPKANSGVCEVEMVLAPSSRTRETVAALLDAGLAVAGERPLLWWTFGDHLQELASEAGRLQRSLHRMTGELPPPYLPDLPSWVDIRGFVPGINDDAWLEVNNAAFSGHPEEGNWDLATFRERQQRPWFRAEGLRMAWAGDRLAGFCWTKVHPDGAGEIYVIAVDPGFQGRGLGREIAREALWDLHARGCRRSFLYVDASNRTALSVYAALGFELDRIDRCFEVPKR
jgi:mycothiol synthase